MLHVCVCVFLCFHCPTDPCEYFNILFYRSVCLVTAFAVAVAVAVVAVVAVVVVFCCF